MIIETITDLKKTLEKVIEKHTSIGILTHKNPDGDGLPAALALQEIIKQQGRKADVILEEPVSKIYNFLDGKRRTTVFGNFHIYKLLIILDCHELERLGKCKELIPTAQDIIAIDHHQQADLIEDAGTYIDASQVSVGAIIFDLYEKEIAKLPEISANYIARALYTTVINDTDNFINSNTDAATFLLCSKLMHYDLEPGKITEQLLHNKPPQQMRFVGEVLSTIQTYEKGQILFMHATREMLAKNGLEGEATSKLSSWVKGVRGVKASVVFQEVNSDRYRLSLRTKCLNVNKIAVKYGGGGHIKASGCEIKGSLEQIQKEILAEFKQQL